MLLVLSLHIRELFVGLMLKSTPFFTLRRGLDSPPLAADSEVSLADEISVPDSEPEMLDTSSIMFRNSCSLNTRSPHNFCFRLYLCQSAL